MGSGFHIAADTQAQTYSVVGNIPLRSGELYYFERSFYLREGMLFLNENEMQTNPRISARAEIRDRTEDGPLTISMIVENEPLLSFTARFESSPPLSQVEIFSLLGQNLTGAPNESGDYRNMFVYAAGDALAQFGLIRGAERRIRNFLHLDMFSLRTQVLQNVVFQAAGLEPEESRKNRPDQGERDNRAGNYFDNTTVFIGKYFGQSIYVQSMLSFRYDEFKTTMSGLRLEPDFGLEMRNPLFDIRVNLVPLHPENWFMDGISFTLTWRRSF
jgi:hypothetical protein